VLRWKLDLIVGGIGIKSKSADQDRSTWTALPDIFHWLFHRQPSDPDTTPLLDIIMISSRCGRIVLRLELGLGRTYVLLHWAGPTNHIPIFIYAVLCSVTQPSQQSACICFYVSPKSDDDAHYTLTNNIYIYI
jgi:hypothetical protein